MSFSIEFTAENGAAARHALEHKPEYKHVPECVMIFLRQALSAPAFEATHVSVKAYGHLWADKTYETSNCSIEVKPVLVYKG